MMNKKILSGLVIASVCGIMAGLGESPVYADNQLDEVIVYGDKYKTDQDSAQVKPVAGGMIGTRQAVGTLGSKDVLDVPFEQMTFSKKAMETFSQPERSAMDVLSLSPSVRVTHGSMDTNLYIRGFSAGSGSWTLNGIPDMSHQMTMPTNYMEWMDHGNLCVRGTFYNKRSDLTITKLNDMSMKITFTKADGSSEAFMGKPQKLPMLKILAGGSKTVTLNFGPYQGTWARWSTEQEYDFTYINGARW